MYLQRQRLNGRTAFITGAAGGIGYCTAEAFAEAGASIIVSDLSQTMVDAAVGRLQEKGYQARGVTLDVTDPDACTAAAERANSETGPVDVLVANAGIALPATNAEDISDDAWRKVLDVNLNGVFWCCRAFSRFMLSRNRGSIVVTGSMSGIISTRSENFAHYNASKAAVHHLVRSLAGEWAHRGVRVNSVAPTYVGTAMIRQAAGEPAYLDALTTDVPMQRILEPEEIASVILFLASDASSGMTGSIVLADAGYTIW